MVQATYLSMGRRHDYRDALAAIDAETLVVHGGMDLQPEVSSRMYAELIDGADLIVVADADHFFDGEHDELGQRVLKFLGGTTAP